MNQRRIDTAIDIDADPNTVWQVLTDFPAYPDWNPFIRSIEGKPDRGSRLSVLIQTPGQEPMRFRPRVRAVENSAKLSWIGRLMMRGLVDGHHEFELYPHGQGTRLLQRKFYSGLLVPLIWNKTEHSTRAGFEAMNLALKARAEAPARED